VADPVHAARLSRAAIRVLTAFLAVIGAAARVRDAVTDQAAAVRIGAAAGSAVRVASATDEVRAGIQANETIAAVRTVQNVEPRARPTRAATAAVVRRVVAHAVAAWGARRQQRIGVLHVLVARRAARDAGHPAGATRRARAAARYRSAPCTHGASRGRAAASGRVASRGRAAARSTRATPRAGAPASRGVRRRVRARVDAPGLSAVRLRASRISTAARREPPYEGHEHESQTEKAKLGQDPLA
jgi:hypothetical protein